MPIYLKLFYFEYRFFLDTDILLIKIMFIVNNLFIYFLYI